MDQVIRQFRHLASFSYESYDSTFYFAKTRNLIDTLTCPLFSTIHYYIALLTIILFLLVCFMLNGKKEKNKSQ